MRSGGPKSTSAKHRQKKYPPTFGSRYVFWKMLPVRAQHLMMKLGGVGVGGWVWAKTWSDYPQVCAAFLSNVNGSTGKKLSQSAIAQVNLRHQSWLCRNSTGSKVAWRPRTRHRISTVRHIAEIDNQYRVSTPTGGLKWCKPDWEDPLWQDANWRFWRFIQGCLHSDVVDHRQLDLSKTTQNKPKENKWRVITAQGNT